MGVKIMRMRFVKDEVPALTNSRSRKPANIPPFSFVGELDIGDSGIWYPPFPILLLQAKVTAQNYGERSALLSFVKMELPYVENVLASVALPHNRLEALVSFKAETVVSPPIIGPTEPIFIRSKIASYHNNVVIQMTGEILD
jgi:hypothetical protein